MADAKKPNWEKVLTLAGTAKFPYLNDPDTKFNKDGEYRIRLVLEDDSNQQAGTNQGRSIKEMLEEAAQKAYDETKAQLEETLKSEKGEKKAKAKAALDKLKLADLPIKPVYDDNGDETGEIEVAFKMKAQRKGKKEGEIVKQAPRLFDSKGGKFPVSKAIWGGSKVKVAGQIIPFYTAAVGAGASLRLSAVQLIELSSGGGGSAESFGFGKEDGYEVEPTDAEQEGFKDESGTEGDGSEDF